jgi:hypothetical protein
VACPCSGAHGCHTSTADVRTGIELAIPLAAIGNPTDAVKIVALINNQDHSILSNQLLKAPAACNQIPTCGSIPSVQNLGNPRNVDLNTIECGSKWFTVASEPTNLHVSGISREPGGNVTLRWPNIGAGQVYTVESSALATPANWSAVEPTNQWPTGLTSWTDTGSFSNNARFYRVRASQPGH